MANNNVPASSSVSKENVENTTELAVKPDTTNPENDDFDRSRARILLLSILVVALCGIVYELIIGAVSSYLIGNSVYQFSLTVGFFMFAMGIGSYLSRYIDGHLVETFVAVEMALAIVGGLCSISLFMCYPYAPWMYKTVMMVFIITIGTLVGLEIPLLTRILATTRGTRQSISEVLSLDYLGALIGSVAFPLFLLPDFGLIGSSFVIGLINALVALLNVIWLRQSLYRWKEFLIAAIGVTAALIGLMFLTSNLTSFARQHLYQDHIVWQKQTPYQNLVATLAWRTNDFRLFIDGHLQFSERDEYRYHEALVHPAMANETSAKNILVLGGGDGLAVREILKYESVKRIDLVDIDPEMTRIAKEFPPLTKINNNALSDPRVHIHNMDAFVFIKDDGVKYDRVIADFPDPHNEAISKLYSLEFYTMVKARMAPHAAMVVQSSSPFFARRTYWEISNTMKSVFGNVQNYSISIPSFGIWGYNMSWNGSPPKPSDFPEGLKFIDKDTWLAARHLPADLLPSEEPGVNSILQPTLYIAYERDMQDG